MASRNSPSWGIGSLMGTIHGPVASRTGRWMRALRCVVGWCLFAMVGQCLAAISIVGSSTATTGAGTAASLAVAPVAGASRADVLLAQVTLDDNTATITPPAGWTEIATIAQSTTGIRQQVYWRIRSNTEPASYTWTFSKAVRGAVILADFSGVDTNLAINASAGQFGSGTTLVAPEVAAAYANGVIVSFFGSTGVSTAIAPQASMTTANSATAASGSSGVRLALAYETVASDGLTGVRTATASSGTFAGQTIALTPTPGVTCFSDDFNRAGLGTNWVTSNSKGGFNPTINTNRLQLTQNVNNQATLAVLQRYFPAAGNNVVVTFRQFAYPNGGGTSGADGIVTIFSDAAVAPAAGGSGGSLGYAQYNSPANTPGFAGGWLGVGIDEYGNFSSASENRYLGPGARTNAIAIRGPSNSFYASGVGSTYAQGYPYVDGSASLAPIVGSTTSIAAGGGPDHRYRITIDSRVPGEQWVQVERSTDGGATYTAHVPISNLMARLRGLAGWGAVTLPTIPANFWLSFTGGTGGARNIHEIDDLQVCATKMIASTPAIDHFRFENPSTMDTCQPKAIKVIACTDAAPSCTQFTGGDVYVTLKPSGWVGGDAVKLIGGKGTLQLAQPSAGTVTLDIDRTKSIWPALKNPAASASECVVPGTSTPTACTLTVNALSSAFGVTFPSSSPAACDDSGDVLIKACSSGYAGTTKALQFWFNYTDPATTADATRVLQLSKDAWATSTNLATTSPSSTSSPAPVSVSFDATATAKVRVKYADVGKLTLNLRDSAATSVTGSGTLIVRPANFVVTAVTDNSATPVANPAAADATGAKFVAAGTPFKVTVEARNNCSTPVAVKNFGRESTPEGVKLDKALVAGLGLTNNPSLTTVTDFSFSNGVGTATLTWPEVGLIKLTPRLKSGSYLGGSDTVGTQSGNIGRFYAHHLDTTVNTQGCSSFTYDRQPIPKTTITAKANGGATLTNYRGSSTASISFAKPVTLTDTTGQGSLSPVVGALAFSAGTAVLDGADADHPRVTFQFTTNPSLPATIAIAAADSDASGVAGSAGSANIRSGRVRLGNAYGSELLALPLPMELQYWNAAWVPNAADTCSVITPGQFAWAFPGGSVSRPNNLAACESAVSVAGTAPNYLVALSAPGATNAGWADLTLNLAATAVGTQCTSVGAAGPAATTANLPWLQFNWLGAGAANPRGHATFGTFRSPLIYRRENY